jgi:hypothetical protein
MSDDKEFWKEVEKKVFEWFDDAIEDADDAVKGRVDRAGAKPQIMGLYKQTFEKNMRAKAKPDPEAWWNEGGGKQYSERAVRVFATILSARCRGAGRDLPNPNDVRAAYDFAETAMNEWVKVNLARIKAPVLCDGPAPT